MPRRLDVLAVPLVALGATLTLVGCTRPAPPLMQRPPAAVTVAAPISSDVPVYLDEIGRTAPCEVVTVQPQVSGTLAEISFADGADLKKGAPLFTIDPRPYKARLDLADAELQQNLALLELARIELDRFTTLLAQKAVSRQDYDTKRNAVAVAEAKVASSRASRAVALVDHERCAILSPLEGRAGTRLVDPGNVVAPGASLVTIMRLDPIYVSFTVTEAQLARVRRHMGEGKLEVLVSLPGEPARRLGDLSFVDTAVQDGTGTVRLRATVPNAERHLWPGQFVTVRLILAIQKAALLVPAETVQVSQSGPFVYALAPDGKSVQLRPIRPGQRQGDLLVVEEGIAATDQVVVAGHLMLYPGAPVQVVPAAPPSGGGGPPGAVPAKGDGAK